MNKLIIASLLLVIVGCEQQGQETYTESNVGIGHYMRTVNHDGHSYVLLKSNGEYRMFIHDPGCPCLKEVHHE